MAPRIYLAGPDVFLPDAREFAEKKKSLCRQHGFEGVFPLDAEIKDAAQLPPQSLALRIAMNNEDLMRSCDLLVAHCTPFRGVSMDAGTAYEVGFMRALRRPVFGYSNVAALFADRSKAYRTARNHAPYDGDDPKTDIEDFGLPENLMIACAIQSCAGETHHRRRSARPGALRPRSL